LEINNISVAVRGVSVCRVVPQPASNKINKHKPIKGLWHLIRFSQTAGYMLYPIPTHP